MGEKLDNKENVLKKGEREMQEAIKDLLDFIAEFKPEKVLSEKFIEELNKCRPKTKEFVLEIIEEGRIHFLIGLEELQNNREWVLEAAKANRKLDKYGIELVNESDEEQERFDNIRRSIQDGVYDSMSEELKSNPEFILEVMKCSESDVVLNYINPDLLHNKEFMLKACNITSAAHRHFPDELLVDKEFMSETEEIFEKNMGPIPTVIKINIKVEKVARLQEIMIKKGKEDSIKAEIEELVELLNQEENQKEENPYLEKIDEILDRIREKVKEEVMMDRTAEQSEGEKAKNHSIEEIEEVVTDRKISDINKATEEMVDENEQEKEGSIQEELDD